MLLFADLPLTFENLYALITSAPVNQDAADAMSTVVPSDYDHDTLRWVFLEPSGNVFRKLHDQAV